MRRRGPVQALTSSPAMVGALTTLVTIVAVFLAYNAHTGLPFVPTYHLEAQVPNANSLVAGNEVRIGGARVGMVHSVTPRRLENGETVAIVDMELTTAVDPLPADSTLMIRPRSSLALKYLEITPGESEQGFEQGDTVPVAAATPEPVELEEFWNMFDRKTRVGVRGNLTGFSDALAGRGPDLNDAFAVLRPLLVVAEPAARNLASRSTNLGGFWRALADTAAEVAPVAETQGQLFAELDTTFAAFASVARPFIQETISRSPATLDEGTRSFPEIRPFLRHSGEFFTALRPGAQALAETGPVIAEAFTVGGPILERTPRINRELAPTAAALVDFQEADGVIEGLDLLIGTNELLDPTMRFLTPAQSVCNYLTLLFRNAGGIVSIGDSATPGGADALGHWVRFLPFIPPEGENAEIGPAAAPASGPEPDNRLHYNPYPNTAAPGQSPRECEAGNIDRRDWTQSPARLRGRTVIGNVPGDQGTRTQDQTPAQLRRGGDG